MNPNKRYNNKSNTPRKSQPPQRSKKENIGIPTGLLDCNGDEIMTGESYVIRRSKQDDERGRVFWNREQKCFGLFYGLWYGDKDSMKPECYGKFVPIPADNGMRMQLVPFISS